MAKVSWSVKVPAEMAEAVDALCRGTGLSRTEVIEAAVGMFIVAESSEKRDAVRRIGAFRRVTVLEKIERADHRCNTFRTMIEQSPEN